MLAEGRIWKLGAELELRLLVNGGLGLRPFGPLSFVFLHRCAGREGFAKATALFCQIDDIYIFVLQRVSKT